MGDGYRLHLIEGDGDHDRLIDRSVSPARPTWRWDNGSLAYVSANGRVVVRDLIHTRSHVMPRGCVGYAEQLGYAPAGSALVAAGGGRIAAVGPRRAISLREHQHVGS